MTTANITVSTGTKGGTAYASSSQTITSKGWNYTKRQPIAQLSGAGTGYQIKYIVNYGNGTDSGQTVYLNGIAVPILAMCAFTMDPLNSNIGWNQ
jgi:hypothetical protein